MLTTKNALSQQTTTSYSTVSLTLGVHGANALEQTTVVDANHHQTASFRDAWGRLIVSETFTGTAAPYALYQQTQDWYDLNGHLAQIVHPDGASTTTYTYDSLGHTTALTDPDRGHETYQYDADGNVTQTVDARGSGGTIYAGYDALDRQTWRNTTNSPTGAYVTYSYDSTANGNLGVGRLTGESFSGGPNNAWTGSYASAYDARGQVSTSSMTINGTKYTTGATYDDAGDVLTQTYPDGEVLTTSYTPEGWPSGLATTFPSGVNGGATVTLLDHLSYTGAAGALGLPSSLGLNGQSGGGDTYTTTATYDALGRPTESKTTRVSDSTLLYEDAPGYDAAGNVVSVNSVLPGGTDNQAFCYDAMNRLTWAGSTGTPSCGGSLTAGTLTAAQYTATYAYDNLDRLTSGPLGSYTYGDSAHLHAATAVGSTYTASYDASGNLTCRAPTNTTTCTTLPTGATLSYDAEGQLTHWQDAPTSPTSTDDALYDGEGTRVLQQSSTNGTTTTTTYLGGLEELSTTGSTTTTTAYYGGVALSVNGVVSYQLSDGLGSATVTLDTSGNVTASRLFGPYGQPRYTSGTMPGSLGFTGQHDDTATLGLDYYGARYYDPTIGQFTSADTVLDGLNRYAYVGGNPESATDPNGHYGIENIYEGGTAAVAGMGGLPTAASASTAPQQADDVTNTGVVYGIDRILGALGMSPRQVIRDLRTMATTKDIHQWAAAGLDLVTIATNVVTFGTRHLAQRAVERILADAADELIAGDGDGNPPPTGTPREQGDGSGRGITPACAGESFSPDTVVATPADGAQPISSLQVGDQVEAYDPATGQTSSQTVQHVFVDHDTDLLDVTLRTTSAGTSTATATTAENGGGTERAPQAPGRASTATATTAENGGPAESQATHRATEQATTQNETVHTTAKHPWLTADHGWVTAGELHTGERVRRADGTTAVVVTVRVVPGAADMWDLTVGQVHTFAVGSGAYVVHNCSGDIYESPHEYADTRAKDLQRALPSRTAGSVTMGVGVVEDPATGLRSVIIGTSERGGYIRAGVDALLKPTDIIASGSGHAEQNILLEAMFRRQKVIAIGAGIDICIVCEAEIGAGPGEGAIATKTRSGFVPDWMR